MKFKTKYFNRYQKPSSGTLKIKRFESQMV